MSWLPDVVDRLASVDAWAYRPGQPSAAEPAAATAICLLSHGREADARRPLEWLEDDQRSKGLPIGNVEDPPAAWTMAWAVLAWTLANRTGLPGADRRARSIDRVCRALLDIRGEPGKHASSLVGHDPTLVAWPWISGTHSWLEPTTLAVLALKACGRGGLARARDGVRLIQDRQLPLGGCNYGNTTILGKALRPHLQPTGLSLLACLGESLNSPVSRTLAYAVEHWREARTASSLSWILLGLAAHGAWPDGAEERLGAVARSPSVAGHGAYHLAMLSLAATGPDSRWLAQIRQSMEPPSMAPPSITPVRHNDQTALGATSVK